MINQPFAVVPVLHSVLFHFTHQVMSGYSIVLIRDPARGTSQQGPRSKFSSGGAKEECAKENFFWWGAAGGMLVDFYSISLK